jgi:hypothetical protein
MIDSRNKLVVIHDDNSVLSDLSLDAADYIRDNFSLELIASEDYLYLGFVRNFGACYIELTVPNTNTNTLQAEYWDGSTWQSLSIQDESKGLTRSGFIQWDKSLLNSTTVNGEVAYYIRLKPSADQTLTTVRGINIVFSDDNRMKREFFEIDNSNLLPPGETSHITTHAAAKDMIIQQLRNMGYIKEDSSAVESMVTAWDLHDMFEVREAATFLALSKIFFTLSDSVDDNWWQKYREYQAKFEESFRLARISFDLDNDGVVDTNENLRKSKSWRWSR